MNPSKRLFVQGNLKKGEGLSHGKHWSRRNLHKWPGRGNWSAGSRKYEGTKYVAVGFVEDLQEEREEEIDIFFLKVNQYGDFTDIESDEEFDKVSSAFDEIMQEG